MVHRSSRHTSTTQRLGGIALLLASALLAALVAASAIPAANRALAEDIDTNPDADELQLQVERTAIAYDEALAAVADADAALEENQARIAELEAQIPEQQRKSDDAARELYKMQKQGADLIDLLLGADSFFDFLANLDYVNRISAVNAEEIARLGAMKAELTSQQAGLEQAREEAGTRAIEAERALTAAQEARLEAQRKAAEAARQAAEAEAAARIAAAPAQAESTEAAATPSETMAEAAEAAEAVVSDGADWASDEAAFVDSWAGRIDAYLSGSPMAGQGRTFAQAAWNYGVDPRWSPAISYTESSVGLYCFMPHNAWGWGSSSWGSWEEAIDAHVRGLARGYGYTISMDAARKYCPPNAQHWYDTTLAQMNLI